MRYSTTFFRVYVASSVLVTCFISWSLPEGAVGRVLLDGKPIGYFFLIVAASIALLAIIDTVINEAAWIPFNSPATLKWRQLLFMFLSIISSSIAFLVLNDQGYHPAVARYLIDSAAAVTVALIGLKDSYDLVVCEKLQQDEKCALVSTLR